MHSCQNNPEKSSTAKINMHTPSDYLLFTNCSFDSAKSKLDCYRDKNCMEKFCKNLKEHASKIPLTDEENKSYEKQNVCYICKKGFSTDDNKKYEKVRDHCHYTGKFRGAVHDICNLIYKTPKEMPLVFDNDSTYDYHFIIKQLAKEFDGQLECVGENTEKMYYFFSTN